MPSGGDMPQSIKISRLFKVVSKLAASPIPRVLFRTPYLVKELEDKKKKRG
jgi:hypothetical protein